MNFTQSIYTQDVWITQWDNEELNYFLYRKNTWFNSTVLIKKSNRRTRLSNSVVKALATPVWEPELGSLRSHVKDDRTVLLSCWCSLASSDEVCLCQYSLQIITKQTMAILIWLLHWFDMKGPGCQNDWQTVWNYFKKIQGYQNFINITLNVEPLYLRMISTLKEKWSIFLSVSKTGDWLNIFKWKTII